MKIEYRNAKFDGEGYPETVLVDGKPVGTFFTYEEGWGCEYRDKLITADDYQRNLNGEKLGQVVDFGELDYNDAKAKLTAILKAMN
ncbi:hypothetical protein [Limosilactobacillus ingluviei]|uniref:Uncharacterized protein n=1 Tax=Limosilactobacillus ingluviei DSM 15946 TaxID=1423760 RepID=A0A0R1UE23_9LACO|nr:hypothetical protein [Limosilactobacillus ingluviei]KRL91673.1 hypothetical protein FC43_GL001093 [Limosilactobacillus ingluviei DSM 15946]